MNAPRLNINCAKIYHNAHSLIHRLDQQGIEVTPVTKVCLGHPEVAKALINAGAKMLADSRIENIDRMRQSGILSPMMLIRSPMLSQATKVVKLCDISLNTDLTVIKKLSQAANELGLTHGVIIMIELGDLREGVMPDRLEKLVGQIIQLPNIVIKGIGSNLTCRNGVAPDRQKMSQLSDLADSIEATFNISLEFVSGGNSANLNWALDDIKCGRVNHLRLGEVVFFGHETLNSNIIEGLVTDTVSLTAEVIESNEKPSLPWGTLSQNSFGENPKTLDRGTVFQAILALGRQDVDISGLIPPSGVSIVASSSDHLIVESSNQLLNVGEEIQFQLNYSALLSSMTSPFICKHIDNDP